MKGLTTLLLSMTCTIVWSQELARFTLETNNDNISQPVSISLDRINYNADQGDLVLYELTPEGEKLLPSQLETGHSARLWFLLKGKSSSKTTHTFLLKKEEQPVYSADIIKVQKTNKDLEFSYKHQPVLNYRFATTPAPAGVDPLYKRSGYIHPLWSPGGQQLTRIQAPDHYHHYGIWGPWTKTHVDGREVDFWNLAKGQGTVRFNGFLSETEGAVYSGFSVLQQHIDFGAANADSIAMNELLDVRVWNLDEGIWMVDYTTTLNCPLPKGIMLDAYRYGGGIGWRAIEKWHKDNCTVLTSEGKTRVDADGSNARWCLVEGESEAEAGRSGILFLSQPANRMHPEPMRVWPLDANEGRGDMYFEFVPIRHKDWKLNPKQDYTLKYRMIVFDGKIEPSVAEKYWSGFATNPKITLLTEN